MPGVDGLERSLLELRPPPCPVLVELLVDLEEIVLGRLDGLVARLLVLDRRLDES